MPVSSRKGSVITNALMASSATLQLIRSVCRFLLTARFANVSDDQGLIQLLKYNKRLLSCQACEYPKDYDSA